MDPGANQVGTIIIPKEITGEEHVIRQHIVFNAAATIASWLAALLVVVLYLAIDDWRQRPQAASLEAALKSGESQEIEFKADRTIQNAKGRAIRMTRRDAFGRPA